MTHPDPDSSQEYNPYELFTEELDLDSFGLEQTPPESVTDLPFTPQDEDRLYTDEVIRRSELASRSLFLSAIAAAIISLGMGLWYWVSHPKPTPQPTAPLPVPEQPLTLPSPGLTAPVDPRLPPNPSLPNPSLPPNVSNPAPGSLPGTLPNNNSTLPTQPNPGGSVIPPSNNAPLPVQPNPSATVVPPPPPTVPGNPVP